jgi:Lipase (class 3)
VVTGHSLGAGIATFVGMHLRRVFFNVQVWCYSPPGWLMTPELADSTKDFVTSVVVNKDLVPRCASCHFFTVPTADATPVGCTRMPTDRHYARVFVLHVLEVEKKQTGTRVGANASSAAAG